MYGLFNVLLCACSAVAVVRKVDPTKAGAVPAQLHTKQNHMDPPPPPPDQQTPYAQPTQYGPAPPNQQAPDATPFMPPPPYQQQPTQYGPPPQPPSQQQPSQYGPSPPYQQAPYGQGGPGGQQPRSARPSSGQSAVGAQQPAVSTPTPPANGTGTARCTPASPNDSEPQTCDGSSNQSCGCICSDDDTVDPPTCKPADDSLCLAGDSIVMLRGRGPSPLATVRSGDAVLTHTIDGKPQYELVLGFLHALKRKQGMAMVTLVHSQGELRASANHIVLAGVDQAWSSKAAGAVIPGEWLAAGSGGSVQVVAVRRSTTTSGMFAPLTLSGTIFVDGVLVSNYALPRELPTLPHGAAHAALFAVRAFYKLGLGVDNKDRTSEEYEKMHPFAEILLGGVRIVSNALRF